VAGAAAAFAFVRIPRQEAVPPAEPAPTTSPAAQGRR
jgi:hypothetical protein